MSGFIRKNRFATIAAAMPPDVRRGSASPFYLNLGCGLSPSFGLCPTLWAKGRTKGLAQFFLVLTARHSLASHQPAEP
jgi:hypothetical protein